MSRRLACPGHLAGRVLSHPYTMSGTIDAVSSQVRADVYRELYGGVGVDNEGLQGVLPQNREQASGAQNLSERRMAPISTMIYRCLRSGDCDQYLTELYDHIQQ